MNQYQIVRRPPVAKVGCNEAFVVRFDWFEDLPAGKGMHYARSQEFTCFGHRWTLTLWPGGSKTSPDGKVAVYLCHHSDDCIQVQASFAVKQSKRKWVHTRISKFRFGPPEPPGSSSFAGSIRGISNFAERSSVIKNLEGGALAVEVRMTQTGPSTQPFVPANPLLRSILKKFMHEESADAVFEVSSDQAEDEQKPAKRAKISPTTFHAHRFIVEESAPALAEACKLKGGLDPVPITGVRPEIFKLVLYYAYGGNASDEDMNENTREILEAADRFGVASLKLAAEACYVKATKISVDNVLDNLVYADAKNCALLKESVMDFIVENGAEVVKRVSLKDVPEGLFGDLLTAVSRGKKNEDGNSGEELCMMRVSELRRKLDEKGLDVDGSREAMIAALEGSP